MQLDTTHMFSFFVQPTNMASLRVKTQEATQRLTQKVIRKVIMEAQNLEERIERVSISAGDA